MECTDPHNGILPGWFGLKAIDQAETSPQAAHVALGGNDYCAVSGPCGAGEGDCDGNHECQAGLVCRNDVGATYGFRAIVDVCEAPE